MIVSIGFMPIAIRFFPSTMDSMNEREISSVRTALAHAKRALELMAVQSPRAVSEVMQVRMNGGNINLIPQSIAQRFYALSGASSKVVSNPAYVRGLLEDFIAAAEDI